MADDRRPARGARPRGRTGPGRTPGAGRTGRPRTAAEAAGRPTSRPPERARLRPTSRLAILAVVFAVLAVGSASSLRAFLQQRSEMQALQQEIVERQDRIDDLAREKRRWQDTAYVRSQARQRLGYVMPGETAYVALDADGDPIEPGSTLTDPSEVDPQEPEAWWGDAWGSVELAGDPPPAGDPVPLKELDGSEEQDQ
ncbi:MULTISPECIES: FtsB family cell division protein [Nocardioides]|uniref:Cell division protein FtsB n=1 Tax=Nocardioides lianchengensis TaxID=1045774 RepID=A0A1G6VSI1_9ACTN|nr:septum formation initiator family protein [Nocardioides lianchengensis]NYG11260.1 cell division protein FtsB [Nocardioides lianchengensis]SDD55795.1 Cell division protein FtsB [Nocardioides lianchengensis]